MKMPADTLRHARISDCSAYRYSLFRKWGCGSPLCFVMLNPSTADGTVDDATVRRCFGFAHSHGFGELTIVNLYAFRATDPRELRRAGYPVGPENDAAIEQAVLEAACVCVAWGANAAGLSRPAEVLSQLRRLGAEPQCLAITRGGHPQHPLMLASSCRLQPFRRIA